MPSILALPDKISRIYPQYQESACKPSTPATTPPPRRSTPSTPAALPSVSATLPLLGQLQQRYGDKVSITYRQREPGAIVIDFARL